MELVEKNRQQIIAKSRITHKGKQRLKKRTKSRISSSVSSYNRIDVNKLFKQDILDVIIPVDGETDKYEVSLSFGGLVEQLKEYLKDGEELDYRTVYRALMYAFNKNDIFLNCSCPDSKYRMAYWQTRNDIINKTPEDRPSDITNPNDQLGNACKHELLVLNNLQWIKKVSAVVYNYIKYIEKNNKSVWEKTLYPLLYDMPYGEAPEAEDTSKARNYKRTLPNTELDNDDEEEKGEEDLIDEQ